MTAAELADLTPEALYAECVRQHLRLLQTNASRMSIDANNARCECNRRSRRDIWQDASREAGQQHVREVIAHDDMEFIRRRTT